MRIGIIGTGAIGGTLAKKLVTAGHQIKITNTRQPQDLAAIAKELGATPATIQEVVKDVAVVIVSVPTRAIQELPRDLFNHVPHDVIIVDTGNYYPFRDGEIEELKGGKVESVWVAEQLGRPVIKAFNNLLAHTLINAGKAAGEEERIALAVAGDDEAAKKVVAHLINDVGFDAVDAGSLSESWRYQPGTPAYCTELNIEELQGALGEGNKESAATIRDLGITKFMERATPPSHEEMIAINRSLFPKNPKYS
jgi:8-hydroxy-5-deazaflavin:NADPH oxidoreductase